MLTHKSNQEALTHPNILSTTSMGRTTRYLNQWYLRIVEQSFDSLLGLAAYRLLANDGKQLLLRTHLILDALTARGWQSVGWFHNPTVRNGVAHEARFIQETGVAPVSVVYTDLRGNSETLSMFVLVNEVTGIVPTGEPARGSRGQMAHPNRWNL